MCCPPCRPAWTNKHTSMACDPASACGWSPPFLPPALHLLVLSLVNGQVNEFRKLYQDIVFSDKGITCAERVCWGTRKDNGTSIVWGSDYFKQADGKPSLQSPCPCPPPSSGILPPRGASPSQSVLSLFLSLCLCLPVLLPNKCCTWCWMHGGGSPHLGCHRVYLWEEGGPRAGWGAGAGAVSCLPPSPFGPPSPMCVPTAVSC